MLAFTSVYFFESGLFNGLQPIQIKNLPFRIRSYMFLSGNQLRAAPLDGFIPAALSL
jgi:hypothetical protein